MAEFIDRSAAFGCDQARKGKCPAWFAPILPHSCDLCEPDETIAISREALTPSSSALTIRKEGGYAKGKPVRRYDAKLASYLQQLNRSESSANNAIGEKTQRASLLDNSVGKERAIIDD